MTDNSSRNLTRVGVAGDISTLPRAGERIASMFYLIDMQIPMVADRHCIRRSASSNVNAS